MAGGSKSNDHIRHRAKDSIKRGLDAQGRSGAAEKAGAAVRELFSFDDLIMVRAFRMLGRVLGSSETVTKPLTPENAQTAQNILRGAGINSVPMPGANPRLMLNKGMLTAFYQKMLNTDLPGKYRQIRPAQKELIKSGHVGGQPPLRNYSFLLNLEEVTEDTLRAKIEKIQTAGAGMGKPSDEKAR